MKRRTFATLAAAGLMAGGVAGTAEAQQAPANFPQKPIEVVVVYPAGGGMDVTARTFARAAEQILGHRFQVVNRVGGGGLVGHTYFAKEAPRDGYTVGVLAMGNLFTDILVKRGSFTAQEFDPIGFFNFDPVVFITRGETLQDWVNRARANPGAVRVGVTPNSATAMAVDILEQQTGVRFTRVPFQGGGPRVAALLNRTIDINPAYYVEAEQHYRTGALKPVAVANTRPISNDRAIPTFPQLGWQIAPDTWGAARFIALPRGVPAEVRNYLAAAFKRVLDAPATREAFQKTGLTIEPKTAQETAQIYTGAFTTISEFLARQQRR